MEKEIAVWYYLQKVSQGRKWHQTRHLGTAPTVQNNLLLLMLKKLIWNFGIILMTKPLNSHQEFYFYQLRNDIKNGLNCHIHIRSHEEQNHKFESVIHGSSWQKLEPRLFCESIQITFSWENKKFKKNEEYIPKMPMPSHRIMPVQKKANH